MIEKTRGWCDVVVIKLVRWCLEIIHRGKGDLVPGTDAVSEPPPWPHGVGLYVNKPSSHRLPQPHSLPPYQLALFTLFGGGAYLDTTLRYGLPVIVGELSIECVEIQKESRDTTCNQNGLHRGSMTNVREPPPPLTEWSARLPVPVAG